MRFDYKYNIIQKLIYNKIEKKTSNNCNHIICATETIKTKIEKNFDNLNTINLITIMNGYHSVNTIDNKQKNKNIDTNYFKIIDDNKNSKLNKITIHFVGIGGIGMSGIAELMLDLGYNIQGSDINLNDNIQRLKRKGIKFFKGHDKNNIKNITAVVFSSAIKKNNPELIECKRLSIPLVSRADMLSELMKTKNRLLLPALMEKQLRLV